MIQIVWGAGGIGMDALGAAMTLGPLVLAILGTIVLKAKGWA